MPLPNALEPLSRLFDHGGQNVVVVVGAGISYGATGKEERASWPGLLKHGVETLRDSGAWKASKAAANLELIDDAFLDAFNLDEVLTRAEQIANALGAPDGAGYASWLAKAVGTLEAQPGRTDALDAIRQLAQAGALILTTNYDDLLSDATELPPVTWRDHQEFLRVLNRDREGILHIHGHWRDPASVVLGRTSYKQILRAKELQFLFKMTWTKSSWLYVGCGNGLDDPNVGRLLRWGDATFGEAGHRHYFLALAQDADALGARADKPANLVPVGYGDHTELPGYLRELAPRQRPGPFVELGPIHGPIRPEGTPPSDIPLPTWKELLDGDVPALAADETVADALHKHGWTLVYDVASVGKTTLALRLAAGPHYRDCPTFYVDLDSGPVVDGYDFEPMQVLAAVRRLTRAKALIVLDNAHRAPQVARGVWDWWQGGRRECRLLILATHIQHTAGMAGDDALTVIANHPGNPAITVRPTAADLRGVLNCIVGRIRGRRTILHPPEAVLEAWHATFAIEMGAFAAAVTGNHDRLARGDWDLPHSAAAAWMYRRHLESLAHEPRENLICLSAFAKQALAIGVMASALPHPGKVEPLLKSGLVERREHGRDRHRSYALREPDWGALLLAAVDPPPDDEEWLLLTACRHAGMANLLSSRLTGRNDDALRRKLWQRIGGAGATSPLIEQLASMPLNHALQFQQHASRNGFPGIADPLFDLWQADAAMFAGAVSAAPLAHLLSLVETLSALKRTRLAADVWSILEDDVAGLAERMFGTPLGFLAAFIEGVRRYGRAKLLGSMWTSLEDDPVRLAECAFETPLDHLGGFIDLATSQKRATLVNALWAALESDLDRLVERALETPLDHFASFVESALRRNRAMLVETLWRALEANPDRLAKRALATPLDHVAWFLDTALRRKRSTLTDGLWAALEADLDRLVERALNSPLAHLASFIETAFGQKRARLVDGLWAGLEANSHRLAERALDTQFDDLVSFIEKSLKHRRTRLVDGLWTALEGDSQRFAERVFGTTLDHLTSIVDMASRHERVLLVDRLWTALETNVQRLAERAFETPPAHVASFVTTAYRQKRSSLVAALWTALEAEPARLAERMTEAPLGDFAAFARVASRHNRESLIDDLCVALRADTDRLAERVQQAPLDHLVAFANTFTKREHAALVDTVWAALETNPDRLVESVFSAPLNNLASFANTARKQGRTALVDTLWSRIEADPDRLAERVFDAPLAYIAMFIRTALSQNRTTLAARIWSVLEADPARFVERALGASLDHLAVFLEAAAEQQQTALVDHVWAAIDADPSRLVMKALRSSLDHFAALVDVATAHGQAPLVDRLWATLVAETDQLQAAASTVGGAGLCRFLARAPQAVNRIAVAKLDVDMRTAFPKAPQLAVQLALSGRDDLAAALRRELLTRADRRWFDAPYDAMVDISVLLDSTTASEKDYVQTFVDAICRRAWLAKQYRSEARGSALAEALVSLALSQPPAILRRFRTPELMFRAASTVRALADADAEVLSEHVQFLGAAQLIGCRLPDDRFVTMHFNRIRRLPSDVLPHRAATQSIEPHQRSLWLGLRVVTGLAATPLPLDRPVIDDTLERWRVQERENATPRMHKSHRFNRSMIDWLTACATARRGTLLPSKEPLWLIAGFDRDPTIG